MRAARPRWVDRASRALVAACLGGGMVAASLFVAVRAANAVAGGPTRSEISFSGTLRTGTGGVVTGGHALSFRFSRGSLVVCTAPATSVITPDPVTGAFATHVNLDMATPGPCPAWLFDGGDVTFEVLVDGAALAPGQQVSPVPAARFADQVSVNRECPSGYARDRAESPGVVCARTVTLGAMVWRDEMIKVGASATAFWIDRYEAAIHAGSGQQLGRVDALGGVVNNVSSSGLTASGAHGAGVAPAVALSHTGQPSGMMTWFQAAEACRLSGKRLVGRTEWFAAATGTVDPGGCNLNAAGPRGASPANLCRSTWGVHDMVGSMWEWTAEWYASVGQVTSPPASSGGSRVDGIHVNYGLQPWGVGYGDGLDGTWNVSSSVFGPAGAPAAALRGGDSRGGARNGVFALTLNTSPTVPGRLFGFRCVVPQ